MPAKYSVVRYVPDLIADERINIGVIVFDQKNVQTRFLTKWERVQKFANQDIRFLKSFAKELAETKSQILLWPEYEQIPDLNESRINEIANKWFNTIQLTEPRASLLKVDELLDDVAERFLLEPKQVKRKYRDRRVAASLAKEKIQYALIKRVGDKLAVKMLKSRYMVPGKHQQHQFDAVVENGVPHFAAHGLSFELPEAIDIETRIKALAYSIIDVQDYNHAIPIGIMTLSPKRDIVVDGQRISRLYENTIETYVDLGADILTESNLEDWAKKMVANIPVMKQASSE